MVGTNPNIFFTIILCAVAVVCGSLVERSKRKNFELWKSLEACDSHLRTVLSSLFPAYIVSKLQRGQLPLAFRFAGSCIACVNVNVASCGTVTTAIVSDINSLFQIFDEEIKNNHPNVEHFKTEGTIYWIAGLSFTQGSNTSVLEILDCVFGLADATKDWMDKKATVAELSIAVHYGDVLACVVGSWKLEYDLLGGSRDLLVALIRQVQPHKIVLSEAAAAVIRSSDHLSFKHYTPEEDATHSSMKTYTVSKRYPMFLEVTG